MPDIPAYCDNCGLWTPSGVSTGGSGNSFLGIVTQCQKCGGRSKMIDGTYDVIGESLKIIKSHDLTRRELKKLNQILQRVIDQDTPAGQIREIIDRELPKASELGTYITKNASLRTDLGIAVALLAILISYVSQPGISEEKIAEKVVQRLTQQIPAPTPTTGSVNSPCWCGSGRKRKKCHGPASPPPKAIQNSNKKPK